MSENKEKILKQILTVYHEIKLIKMAKLLGFKNSMNLERWILQLPEKYHPYLTIAGNNVIIDKEIANLIDELSVTFAGWTLKESHKLMKNEDLKNKQKIQIKSSKKLSDSIESVKLGDAGIKFFNLITTYSDIKLNRFIKIFDLEELTEIDDWLLNLPERLGDIIDVRIDKFKIKRNAPSSEIIDLAKNFDDWITALMRSLTRIDESAINREKSRFPNILGPEFQQFFNIYIEKSYSKYLVFSLYGENYFTSKSTYGDKTFQGFRINKEVKEYVYDFQPEEIKRKKKEVVDAEVRRQNGKRVYYVSPAGRNISRTIKTSPKDFKIRLKHLLEIVNPVKITSTPILLPTNQQNILNVKSPAKMCAKCGKIFEPIKWLGWEVKYLSTSGVYVCENCNIKLNEIISEERKKREEFNVIHSQANSQKSKVKNLSILNFGGLVFIGIFVFSYYLLLIPLIILVISFIYLLKKNKTCKEVLSALEEKENIREKDVLNSIELFHFENPLKK